MTLRIAGDTSGFIPEATGQVIAFGRDQSAFPINKYVQYVPTKTMVGVYTLIERDAFVRVPNDAMWAWKDGDPLPLGEANKHRFTTVSFETARRAYPWTLGYLTIDQTTLFKPKLTHTRMVATQALTNRTQRVITLLETATNWQGNTSSVNTLNGGKGPWGSASADPNSPYYLAIWRSLMKAAQNIHLACNGQMSIKDLRVIVSPGLAIAAAQSAEITDYVREQPSAPKIVEEGMSDQEDLWGLPTKYKGFQFCVESSMRVSEVMTETADIGSEATANRMYIKADSSAVIVSRVGGLDGEMTGGPNFSTVQLYHHQELLRVKAHDDSVNERVQGAVTENIKEVLAAPVSGWLLTNTL